MTNTPQEYEELRRGIHARVLNFLLQDRRKKYYPSDLTNELMGLIKAHSEKAIYKTVCDCIHGDGACEQHEEVEMSNKEILEKAIQKAIDGGYKYKHYKYFNERDIAFQQDNNPDEYFGWMHLSPIELIFNHDFAKALFGEELWENQPAMHQYYDTLWDGGPDEFGFEGEMWQYRLQAMVIAEDPIKYLGENL